MTRGLGRAVAGLLLWGLVAPESSYHAAEMNALACSLVFGFVLVGAHARAQPSSSQQGGAEPAASRVQPAAPPHQRSSESSSDERPGAAPSPAGFAPSPDSASSRSTAPSSTGARVELSLLSAPFGAVLGSLACGIGECDEPRLWAAANLLTAGGAVTLSALLTRGGPFEYATAQAIEGGALWGLITPVYVALITSPDSGPSRSGILGGMLGGELIGAGLGVTLERTLSLDSGAVAMANSGALWLPAVSLLTAISATSNLFTDAGRRGVGGGLLAAELIGLGLGGWFGQRDGAERTQVWLSDVGAVMLGGAMPLFTWLLAGDNATPRALTSTTAVGMAAGFAGAYALTRFLPKRGQRKLSRLARLGQRARVSFTPLSGGGALQLGGPLR